MTDILEPLKELARKWKEAAALMPNSPSGTVMIAALTTCATELESLIPAIEKAVADKQGRLALSERIRGDLEREINKLEAEIAALKEPMACRHTKACLARKQVKCNTCDGTGEVHSHNPVCWDCKGGWRTIETCTACAHEQEKLCLERAAAVLEESEKPGCTNATCPYCTWERARLDERLAANRAKVGEGKS